MSTRESYDVLVVGARCAGAATAMLMARRGLRVLVIDRSEYGTDTISTHALMRGGVLQLSRWGLLPRLRESATPVIRNTCFHYGDEVLDIAIQPSPGLDGLYAPRRTVLDSMLVDAAWEAGAVVRHGHRLADLIRRPDGRVCGATVIDPDGVAIQISADLVVGADGINSTVARLVDAPVEHAARHAAAVAFGYFPGIDLRGYHWYYQTGLSIGAIPTTAGRHCVFVSVPPAHLRSDAWRNDKWTEYCRLLACISPDLAASVQRSGSGQELRVFAGYRGYMRQACGPGWALVGDAGYFKDPLTAHGITDAFRDAELLARAAVDGTTQDFAAYALIRDALSLPLFEVTDAIASFDWDLDQIQVLHKRLNQAMKQETAHLLTLDDITPPPSQAPGHLITEEVS